MVKILITGANGQVGSCLVTQLKDSKYDVLALDKSGLDISDKEAVFTVVEQFVPTIIINAAAYTAVDKAESESSIAHDINAQGPLYLAEAAAKIGAVLLHISTDYVFNGLGEDAYREDDKTDPHSVYGRTKLEGELAVLSANPRSIILRTAWVFGEIGNNFVKTMLRLAKNRDSLGIVGDQVGGPTYAGDIASALIQIAQSVVAGKTVSFGIYHFTGMPYVSWFEFAQAIFAEALQQGVIPKQPQLNKITTADYPTPAKRPFNSRLDLSKIKSAFDINPSDWQAALKRIKAYEQ